VPIAARASNECDGEGFNRTLPIRSAIGVAANMQAFSFFRCEPAHTKAARDNFPLSHGVAGSKMAGYCDVDKALHDQVAAC
jgi:hypothetical protein